MCESWGGGETYHLKGYLDFLRHAHAHVHTRRQEDIVNDKPKK